MSRTANAAACLTGVLKGRTIMNTQSEGGELRIAFDDGSVMTARTGRGPEMRCRYRCTWNGWQVQVCVRSVADSSPRPGCSGRSS